MKKKARKRHLTRARGKEKARKRMLAREQRPQPQGEQERLVRNITEIWTEAAAGIPFREARP